VLSTYIPSRTTIALFVSFGRLTKMTKTVWSYDRLHQGSVEQFSTHRPPRRHEQLSDAPPTPRASPCFPATSITPKSTSSTIVGGPVLAVEITEFAGNGSSGQACISVAMVAGLVLEN
jgi:hypothetical protein